MTLSRTTVLVLSAALSVFGGCAAEDGFEDANPVDDIEAQSVSESGDAITTRYPAGTTARTTASLNLRSTPSTSARIILVMPNGSRVTLTDGVPQSGWYQVNFNGQDGWAFGQYLSASAAVPPPPPGGGGGGGVMPGASFSAQLSRADSGEGFSYYWGHGAWDPSGATAANRGSCSGSCPSCSHSGRYGADCSGFVGKVWQINECAGPLTTDRHGPGTSTYRNSTGGGQWSQVSRANLRGGDALVYNSGGSGHIVWAKGGDGWGALDLYESRGCRYGVTHNTRTIDNSYVAIRLN